MAPQPRPMWWSRIFCRPVLGSYPISSVKGLFLSPQAPSLGAWKTWQPTNFGVIYGIYIVTGFTYNISNVNILLYAYSYNRPLSVYKPNTTEHDMFVTRMWLLNCMTSHIHVAYDITS